MLKRTALATTAALAALASTTAASAEPRLFKSPPCVTAGYCAQLYTYAGGTEPIHSFRVTTPSPGKLLVSVTGSMQCGNGDSRTIDVRVVDVSGKIVRRGETVSAVTENVTPFAMRFTPRTTSYDVSSAINLANSRYFNVKKGEFTFDYWLVKNRVDEGTFCNVFDVNFTALFVP